MWMEEIRPSLRLAVAPVLDLHPSGGFRVITATGQFRYDAFQILAASFLKEVHAVAFDVAHIEHRRPRERPEQPLTL